MDFTFVPGLKNIQDLISVLTTTVQTLKDTKQDKLVGNSGEFVSFNDENKVYSTSFPETNKLKIVENEWGNLGSSNILPTTNNWVMSNGQTPTIAINYNFSATFTSVWEAFSCFFSEDIISLIKGKTMKIGVNNFISDSCRLELVVDNNSVAQISNTTTPYSVEYTFPISMQSVTLRVICFSDTDNLSCSFENVYMYNKDDEDSDSVFFQVRLKLQDNLPTIGERGSFYITEKGNIYFTGADGSLLNLKNDIDK